MNDSPLEHIASNPEFYILKLLVEALPAAILVYVVIWWLMRPKDGRKLRKPILTHGIGVVFSVAGGAVIRVIAMATFTGRDALEPAIDTGAAGTYLLLVPAVFAAGYIGFIKRGMALLPSRKAHDANEIYVTALAEIEGGELDKGTWARCFAEADGDESKTKAAYIKARAMTLRRNTERVDTQPRELQVYRSSIQMSSSYRLGWFLSKCVRSCIGKT